jgi:hypothetical protein
MQMKIDLSEIHQIEQMNNANNPELSSLVISDFRIKKRSTKIFPDHLSKVIFKCLQANGLNLSPSDFISAIEVNSDNDLFSMSTMSYGVTP